MRRTLAGLLFATVVAAACGTSIPSPSPRATLTASASAPTALDECDPLGVIACQQQAAFISIPISDTGLALTWSSQWAPGRTDRPGWDASSLGLGGWSVSGVQRYVPADGILVGDDGPWRFASGVKLADGGMAVPSYDGSLAYVFDAAGRHVRTVDGHIGTTLLTISYDAAGRLVSVEGSVRGGPVHLEVKRAADGIAQGLAGMDGSASRLDLDGNGKLAAVTDPAGHTTALGWAPGGLVTSVTDALGGVRRFTYDQAGRLVAASDPDGVTQQLTRTATASSTEIRSTTAMGRTTTYRAESAPDGAITRTLVAPDGTTTTETTAADGSRTVALPDGSTRSIGAHASAIWGTAAPVLTPDVTKRPDGITSRTEVKQVFQPIGGVPYTASGTVTTTTNGQTSVEKFEPSSRTTTTVDGAGRSTVDIFDPAGRIISQTAPGAPIKSYTYDAEGRETSVTVGSGSAAQTSRFAYDASTGHESVNRPDGTIVMLGVDANGDLTTQTSADGSTVVEAYDANGRPTQVQPAGGLSSTIGYSPAGRPTLFLPPAVSGDASAQTTTYDADGLPASIAGLGSRAIAVTFDASGRVASWTFDQGIAKEVYDPSTGLEARSMDPSGEATSYGFAGVQLDALRWSGQLAGSVSVTIDANGRASGESVDGASAIGLTYDGAGDLMGIGQMSLTRDEASGLVIKTALGAVTTQQQYDGAQQLIRATTTVSGTILLDLQYTRDALGRIVSVVQARRSGSTETTYTYDGSDRLATIRVNDKAVEAEAYDAAGDRILARGATSITNGTYDARNRLMSWGGMSYAWSPDGTLASISGPSGQMTFHYDGLGQLRGVTLANGRTVAYVVDADGRRVGRSVGGALQAGYLYDPAGELVAETDGAGKVLARFGYDDQGHLALVARDGNTYRVITDPDGSPRLVIDDQSGLVADAIDYDAWGRITRDAAPGFIPFGFAGGLLDPDTGLVHLGARDYDPSAGRWTQADPIGFEGGDADLYRYAAGDPINQVDPSGLCVRAGYGGSELGGVPCQPGSDKLAWPWPPAPPPPPPPIFRCSGLNCTPPPNSPNPANPGCWFGDCNFGPNGSFNCVSVVYCQGPNGGGCWLGSCSYGDTHLQTADRTHVDFQAAGEFLVATSPDNAIEVEARQEPVFGGTVITFNTAVAANVDGDHIGVYTKESSFLVVNGQPVGAADVAEQLPHGGSIERHGGRVTISWPGGSRLDVTRNGSTLDYTFAASKTAGATLRGLLGNADGNAANDLTGRDSRALSQSDPDFHAKIYSQFGNSWRITQAESLFDYGPGEGTATFTNLAIPSAEATVASLDPSARARAQTICRAAGVRVAPLLDDCVLDVGETGDASFAAGTAAVAASGATVAGTQTSPAQVTPITPGQTLSGQIASTAQEDEYTFTGTAGQAVYLQAHATCNGSLSWDVVGPSEGLLADERVCVDLQRVELRTSGTYTIRINNDRSASGAYGFSLLAVPAKVVTPISIGQTVSGALTAPGQLADYTFDGSAGATITARATGACVNGLGWQLLGPAGNLLDFNVACRDMTGDRLSVSGTYTIRVFGERTTVGAYTLVIRAGP